MHDRVSGRDRARAPRPLHRPNHSGRSSAVRVRVPLQAVQEDRAHVGQSVLHRIRIRQVEGKPHRHPTKKFLSFLILEDFA